MTTPTEGTSAPAPTDRPLCVAAVVSSILALPGIGGFFGLATFAMAMWTSADPLSADNLPLSVLALVLLAIPPVGFYLLLGYWQALRRGAPTRHPRRFWWLSAGYNVLAALFCLGVIADLMNVATLGFIVLAIPTLLWTVFMVRISVERARRSPAAFSREPAAQT